MTDTELTLASLIHPFSPEDFKRRHWEQSPLVIKREEPGYYHDLMTLAGFDDLLALPLRSPRLRILRKGDEVSVGSPGYVEDTYGQFQQGCTIALQFLQERVSSLARLCRALAAELSATFQVNAYLTPPDEQGLDTHYDTHDVFVLQIAGVKHWRLFNEAVRLPLPGQEMRPVSATQSDLIAEVDLYPGDAIYIPRGFGHDAVSVGSTSLHLTVGVRPITWAFVLLAAMEEAIERDPQLRESLPVGFACGGEARVDAERRLAGLIETFGPHVDVPHMIENAAAVIARRTGASLDRHLVDLTATPDLRLDTRVRRRPTPSTFAVAGGKAELTFHGKTLRMPEFVSEDLEFIRGTGAFTPQDLPGNLDDPGRLVLVKRLVREGLLTIDA
ncbi:cupin domain-containing protein [Mycobacterium sp. DL99]|uniref:cupin domain-containing protein n=1 Tax=Mycobacterium sp. DL99 TaxID=2528957 RepID=UPI001436B11D|nr:cupin domain-containing protein [Mycobacterium sp. DL99]